MRKLFGTLFAVAIAIVFGFSTYVMADPPPPLEKDKAKAEEKMEKAVSVSRDDLSTIRTGRANPSMFNRIVIDYYGSATPITQLASINVAEARMVVIKPYEAGTLGSIEAAIRNSDLGVNPTNDGTLIRVAVPQLTEERRRELVKQAKAKGEDAKNHKGYDICAPVGGQCGKARKDQPHHRYPDLIICVDAERGCSEGDVPIGARVLRFKRKINPAAVLALANAR